MAQFDRNWNEIWKRLNSGVLSSPAKDSLYFIVHERAYTRERGFRLLPNVYETPFCLKCDSNLIESQVHKYCLCSSVSDAWCLVRQLMENLDISIVFESDFSIIHLFYTEPLHGHSVLWLIGEYVCLVESVAIKENKKLSRDILLNHLRQKWLEIQHMATHAIDFIPGLFPVGIG